MKQKSYQQVILIFFVCFKSPFSFQAEISPLFVLRVSSVLPTAERLPFMLQNFQDSSSLLLLILAF